MTAPEPSAVLRRAEPDDAAAMSVLHASCISEGFLVTLGPRFLRRLYGRVVRSPHAFGFVADAPGGVCGYVACSIDTGAFYRQFAMRDGVVAGAMALPGILRSPRHVWETWRYGARTESVDAKGDPGGERGSAASAEILAMAVAPEVRGRHLGAALASAAVAEFERRGVASARVVTATGNVAAVRAYEAAGFRRTGSDEVHRGVSQEVLTWP